MSSRIQLFGVEIDVATIHQAVDQLLAWSASPQTPCRYVVTPNVDHVVKLQENAELRAAYDDADLVLADGWPVVAASRMLKKPLPERVAGSDLAPLLFKSAPKENGLRVFLLGAAPGVGQRAAEAIHQKWPQVQVVGVYSPPMGFEKDIAENEHILSLIRKAAPDVLVVGLGAPKQELWVHRHCERISASVALCVGATIDFLAGEKHRAPRWVRRIGLEWMHRMLSEPKRLARRYARDAFIFPRLVWSEWQTSQRSIRERSEV